MRVVVSLAWARLRHRPTRWRLVALGVAAATVLPVLTQGIANISTSAGYQADWAALFGALTIAIIPMIIIYSIFQRQIQSGLTAGATS